jgi:membrane-associated phospholipid phosphatase
MTMARRDGALWLAILAVGLLDAIWLGHASFRVVGFAPAIVCVATLLLIAAYVNDRTPRLAGLAYWSALWFCYCLTVGILSYLCATIDARLRDDEFTLMDQALGFDWLAVFNWVRSHEPARLVLIAAYCSFIPQLIATLVYFALRGEDHANRELLWTQLLSSLATVAIAGLLPAVCPWVQFGTAAFVWIDHLADFTALRDGAAVTFALSDMKGIVTFPSFHTAAAVLLVYAHRRERWLLSISLVLNGLMLLSVSPIGGHYLVDVVAGAAVAGLTIAAIEWRRLRSPSVEAAIEDAGDPAYPTR